MLSIKDRGIGKLNLSSRSDGLFALVCVLPSDLLESSSAAQMRIQLDLTAKLQASLKASRLIDAAVVSLRQSNDESLRYDIDQNLV